MRNAQQIEHPAYSYQFYSSSPDNLKLIGGIKIRLKISIFYGEKVVHLADF